jgi:oligopeptide/dipeptide ABC transporter ATP-binding protein
MTNLLEVANLSVEYRPLGQKPHSAVMNLSLNVPAGTIVGLVGESGCGKSTTSLACIKLTRGAGVIASGSVRLDGQELLTMSDRQLQAVRGKQVGYITQNPRASLHPVMRVGDQISAVYRAHTRASPAVARGRVLELLQLVGINDPARRYSAYPDQLSGGMAQRIVIAMALACSPRLIIADEPTSGLDVTVQGQILDDLLHSVRTVGSGLLLVTQNLAIVANYCDDIYLMHAGEIVEHGTTSTFFARPAHPASLALLTAERRLQGTGVRLHGMPVDVRVRPDGCQLAPRCPFVSDAAGCRHVHPELVEVQAGQVSRCLRAAEVAAAWQEQSVASA